LSGVEQPCTFLEVRLGPEARRALCARCARCKSWRLLLPQMLLFLFHATTPLLQRQLCATIPANLSPSWL